MTMQTFLNINFLRLGVGKEGECCVLIGPILLTSFFHVYVIAICYHFFKEQFKEMHILEKQQPKKSSVLKLNQTKLSICLNFQEWHK